MTTSSSSRVFVILFLASAFLGLGLFCDRLPQLIENYMKKTVDLATNDMIRGFWAKPPIIFPSYYWLYNITNPAEFLQGDKPMIDKVGPFYFTSTMEKRIVEISKNNYRITYNSTRIFSVNESTVGANFDAPIYTVNVILPSMLEGVAEKTRSMDPEQANMLSSTAFKMAEKFNESIIMRTTPREMLLGRKSVFLQKAMKLADAFGGDAGDTGVQLPKDGIFGLVHSQNGSLQGPFEVYTGYGETKDSLGNLISFQGKQRSPHYQGACSKIQVSAGELRPFPIAPNQTLDMYRPELGRVIHLKPTGVHKIKYGLAVSYVFSELDFVRPLGDPRRDCYCVNGTNDNYCSLNGAIELGPVQSFAPLIFTTSTIEPDEKIRHSMANYSPDLLSGHVESLVDADKTCQFLVLKALGLPVKADLTATLFIKTRRNSKSKSMASIPELSYLPVVMQRERIDVPEQFLAPLANVNTLIELSKHMKVVFYVSAIFLIVPLTNLYYHQSSSENGGAGELGSMQANNNNNDDPGSGSGSGSSGQALQAGDARGAGSQAPLVAGSALANGNPKGDAFVLPVNIGNLTPPEKLVTGGAPYATGRANSVSINQVGCYTVTSSSPSMLARADNAAPPPSQMLANLDSTTLDPDNWAPKAAGKQPQPQQQQQSLQLQQPPMQHQQQQARYFSKLDQLRNPGSGEELARASVSSISSKTLMHNNNKSWSTTTGLENSYSQAANQTCALNTRQASMEANTNTTTAGGANGNNNDMTFAQRKHSLLAAGGQSEAAELVTGGAGPVPAGGRLATTGGGGQRPSQATLVNLQAEQQQLGGEQQQQPVDVDEFGGGELEGADEQARPGRRHRNWFVKVYADVVRVLNNISKSISTAGQLDIDEANDVHDKQLEMLAGRIDNWYGGTGSDQEPESGNGPTEHQSATGQAESSSSNAAKQTGASVADQGSPSDLKSTETKQVSSEAKNAKGGKVVVKREAAIAEEVDPSLKGDLLGFAPEAASSTVGTEIDQTANLVDLVDEQATVATLEARSINLVDHETQTTNPGSASSILGAEDLRDGTGSESPVKSLAESAMGLSVDIESTTEADNMADKAVALQKLEQTIEKLEEIDQADQMAGDLLELSLRDASTTGLLTGELTTNQSVEPKEVAGEVGGQAEKSKQSTNEDDSGIEEQASTRHHEATNEVSSPSEIEYCRLVGVDAETGAESGAGAGRQANQAPTSDQGGEIKTVNSGDSDLELDADQQQQELESGVVVVDNAGGDVGGDQAEAVVVVDDGAAAAASDQDDNDQINGIQDRATLAIGSEGQLTSDDGQRAEPQQEPHLKLEQGQEATTGDEDSQTNVNQDKQQVTASDNQKQKQQQQLDANGDEQASTRDNKNDELGVDLATDSALNDESATTVDREQQQQQQQVKLVNNSDSQQAADHSLGIKTSSDSNKQHSIVEQRPSSVDRLSRRRQQQQQQHQLRRANSPFANKQHQQLGQANKQHQQHPLSQNRRANEIMAGNLDSLQIGPMTGNQRLGMSNFPVSGQLGIIKSAHRDKFPAYHPPMRPQAAQAS